MERKYETSRTGHNVKRGEFPSLSHIKEIKMNIDISILEHSHEFINLNTYMNSWQFIGLFQCELAFEGFAGIDSASYYAIYTKEHVTDNISETPEEKKMLDKHMNTVIMVCGIEENYISRCRKNDITKVFRNLKDMALIEIER